MFLKVTSRYVLKEKLYWHIVINCQWINVNILGFLLKKWKVVKDYGIKSQSLHLDVSSRNELFIVDDNVEVIKVSELTAKVAPRALAGTVCLSIASTLDFFPF